MKRVLLVLALLCLLPREAHAQAFQSSNVAGAESGPKWQGFSPTWIPGLALWLRADLGVTSIAGPVTATGTTPPTVTLAGTPTATQTISTTPYVELDCTTLGALGTSKYTVKVNGATTATNVTSAASGVVLTGSGLTAGWAVGASAVNDVYTSNITASSWADQSGGTNSATQAMAAKQPTVVASDVAYGGAAALSFAKASSQVLVTGSAVSAPQPDTIIVIGQSDGVTQGWPLGTSTVAQGITINTGGLVEIYAGTLASSGQSTTSPAFIGATLNGASSTVRLNGSAITATVNANTTALGGNFQVGMNNNQFINGKAAEAMVFTGSLDVGSWVRLVVYAANRYHGAWQ